MPAVADPTTRAFLRTDPVALTKALIAIPSVTPDDGAALTFLERHLSDMGFQLHSLPFGEEEAQVPNLYARLGSGGPNFCFAGHTDVVAAGSDWISDAFVATERDGMLFGRGAADMKGALAAFVVAAQRVRGELGTKLQGSISLLLTGDEEGPALFGTKAVCDWLNKRGETLDACLVGEPTCPLRFGDMMKVGRRGSFHGVVTVQGRAGHVAYPHLADNPIPSLLTLLNALTATELDAGNEFFPPSNLEIMDLQVGNDIDNVIPEQASARFNVRFNSEHSPASLEKLLRQRCDVTNVAYTLNVRVSGDSFLTPQGPLTEIVSAAVQARCGRVPERSTSGGTSDARFIQKLCPVVEFGLVGASMHKANECTAACDIAALADIYTDILRRALHPKSELKHIAD